MKNKVGEVRKQMRSRYCKSHYELIINVKGKCKYGRVHVPPLGAYGVLVVSPAEHALVGTGQGWGRFHALVTDGGVL